MKIPNNLFYTKDHEWVKFENEYTLIGITDYAQSELGDIIFVELPIIGKTFKQGDSIGTIEAVKTVSDLYLPLSGEIIEFNESLEDEPENVNTDPYGDGWMIKIKISNPDEIEDLLDEAAYQELIGA